MLLPIQQPDSRQQELRLCWEWEAELLDVERCCFFSKAEMKVWCICKEQSSPEVVDVCCVNGIAIAAPQRGAGLQM